MDSYSNRGSSLFTTFSTVLFVAASLNHLTSYFHSAAPTGSASVSDISKIEYLEFRPYNADQLRFGLDLDLDLTSEYNWNVNQLYVFVVASYETQKNQKNEVVVYDKILRSVDEFKFKLSSARIKYVLRDEFKNTMAGKKVTLSVRYQVMPIFGLLRIKELPAKGTFTVPESYNKEPQGSSPPKSSKKR